MATKSVSGGPQPTNQPKIRSAWRRRDWETLTVVGLFVLALLATVWMILISVTDNRSDPGNQFRIVPAASLMLMVEIWLILTLPFYGKLAFWGAIITIATYLFFAVPFVGMGLLSGPFAVGISIGIFASLIGLLLLFRQRDRFLHKS
jgi:hypothetical protein